MSVDRELIIRVLTNFDHFSDIIKMLIDEGFSFNEDGIVVSLSEDDEDDFDYIDFESFDIVKDILDKREAKGYSNYIVIWENNIDERFLVSSSKLDNTYVGCKNHYDISLSIGHGKRIKGAERYTDFGIYLNRLIPIFIKHSMYVCEIHCRDW